MLAAGGTGGHLFPALALADALMGRGHVVDLITDHRAKSYMGEIPVRNFFEVASASPSAGGLVSKLNAARLLAWGTLQARAKIARAKADIVVGFGGYPTVPPVLAGALLGRPTLIHEANAVLGRANKLLAKSATAIATSLADTDGLGRVIGQIRHTGNPVRAGVLTAAETPYSQPEESGPLELLVFGGSQGAHIFSQVIPAALAQLPELLRARLHVTQQVRQEDQGAMRQRLAEIGQTADIAPFFPDMAQRIAKAHFVICRSGASTIAELAIIGRPALLVPYPHALDHDQKKNAAALMAAGGAIAIDQKDLSPERLASELESWLSDPAKLTHAADAAKTTGLPDAVERLADFVEELVYSRSPKLP